MRFGEFLKDNSVPLSSGLYLAVMFSAAMIGFFFTTRKRVACYFVLCTAILSVALYYVAYDDMVREDIELIALALYFMALLGGFAYGYAPNRNPK